MPLSKRAAAEFVGTFWLVFGGCGSAVLSAGLSPVGNRFPGRRTGLWPYRADHGFRHRPYFRLSPQPGGIGRIDGGQAFFRQGSSGLCSGSGAGRHGGRRGSICHRDGQAGIRTGRIRFQWFRRALARRLLAGSMPDGRDRSDLHVPDDHSGLYRPARSAGLCAHRHRPGPDADPPDRHSGHESFGEPGAKHGSGGVCGRVGDCSNCGSSGWLRLLVLPSRALSIRWSPAPTNPWGSGRRSRRRRNALFEVAAEVFEGSLEVCDILLQSGDAVAIGRAALGRRGFRLFGHLDISGQQLRPALLLVA